MTATQRRSQTVSVGKDYHLVYNASPTLAKFHAAEAFVKMVMGPRASGKSSGCVNEIFKLCKNQLQSADGLRRSRWAIVRSTYPELESTTLKTWLKWFPPEYFGELRMGYPITFYLNIDDIRAEIIFLAIENENDIKKLLSFELSGAYINEAKEVPKVVLDGLTDCVGRYPSVDDGGSNYALVIADTNPPEEDHWIPKLFGDSPPDEEDQVVLDDPLLKGVKFDENQYQLFKQPSGLSPEAENLQWLRGGRLYYILRAQKKSQAWINVMIHGLYGSSSDGKLVYPEFNELVHIAKAPLVANPGLPLFLGWDHDLNGALVIAQVTPSGRLFVLEELPKNDLGVENFIRNTVTLHMQTKYRSFRKISFGDPSGDIRMVTDESTVHETMGKMGFPTEAAWTNDPTIRRDAVAHYLNSSPGGLPGFQMDPRCKVLKHGFLRGYKFKKVRVEGQDRYTDKIDKRGNMYTGVQDALQYIALGVTTAQRDELERARLRKAYKRYEAADSVVGY